MWILLAFGSALFAGLTSIFAKIGIRHTDATLATALRTVIVLVFSWIMVFLTGAQSGLTLITARTLLFLVLSGLATGASWLCYFQALQLGDVNKVVPIDKSSTVITVLLAVLILGEPFGVWTAAGIAAIGIGTILMIDKKDISRQSNASTARWLPYAIGSAVFAALTSILGKIGISGIDSNLGTAIRTSVVLLMAWLMVFITKKQSEIRFIVRREWLFLGLSGLATGASWLCYYRALQLGPASVVVPIDKLSVLVAVAFSFFVFHEHLKAKAWIGLALIVAGTLVMVLLT